jgi:hypothetical protein
MCANVIVQILPSPDGELEAVLYERDCGATTGFSTQVSVVPKGDAVGAGNVLVADCDHGTAPGASWGGPPAAIEWAGDRRLLVRYHAKSRVFKTAKELQVGGWFRHATVTIEFEAVPDLQVGDGPAS